MSALSTAVATVADWPVPHAAAAVVGADGVVLAGAGDVGRVFALASVTKLLTAYATLVAVDDGLLDWDDPAGPPGATVAHLAAHCAGYAFDVDRVQATPGTRRIYSNVGFDRLGERVATAAGVPFALRLAASVLHPLDMDDTELDGSPAADGRSSVADLARFAAELLAPTLVPPAAVHRATTVAFPGLAGVLPGYGRQEPNDWGLGFEVRAAKSPHWTGSSSSPGTFGHFGAAGTFLWVDPVARAACVALTDRPFGPWAVEAWPRFTDGVLAAL